MSDNKRKRYEKLQAKAGEMSAELEDIVEELETALENIPENLREGLNAQKTEARIDAFREQIENLDEILEFNWAEAE